MERDDILSKIDNLSKDLRYLKEQLNKYDFDNTRKENGKYLGKYYIRKSKPFNNIIRRNNIFDLIYIKSIDDENRLTYNNISCHLYDSKLTIDETFDNELNIYSAKFGFGSTIDYYELIDKNCDSYLYEEISKELYEKVYKKIKASI